MQRSILEGAPTKGKHIESYRYLWICSAALNNSGLDQVFLSLDLLLEDQYE